MRWLGKVFGDVFHDGFFDALSLLSGSGAVDSVAGMLRARRGIVQPAALEVVPVTALRHHVQKRPDEPGAARAKGPCNGALAT